MKISTLLLFLFITSISSAQKALPIIKASFSQAFIYEGTDDRSGWRINPKIKPDIHTITKSVQPKWIRFITDIDSIKVKLHPGEQFNFIVLLNSKDSCYTRLESLPLKNYARQKPIGHDTIPFVLTANNNIQLKAIINKTDTLSLMFDSGCTSLLLTDDAIKNKTHLSKPESANNSLQIGSMKWDSLDIEPVELSGQGSDGRFGWDLFDGKIIEIDYDKNLFIVHTKMPAISAGYSKLEMQYIHSLFCISGELQIKDKRYKNRFLFDNGYQRTIMLDTILMNEQHYPRNLPVIKKLIMKNGQGKEIPVITVNNERLNLGKAVLLNIPVQLMATANPAKFKTHILGNEVLKRFNTILDFQNNFVYLKPNMLFDMAYKDAK